MRGIEESGAVERDDSDAFTPRTREEVKPQAMRSVPSGTLSRLLVPQWLCHRALEVSVATPERRYQSGEAIPVRVTLRNRFPIPVSVRTRTPRLWTWTVDGVTEGSRLPDTVPEEERVFTFDRGERKQFDRRWSQSFKVSEREWEPADPGEYTIGAHVDVDDPAGKGLAAKTTVHIE